MAAHLVEIGLHRLHPRRAAGAEVVGDRGELVRIAPDHHQRRAAAGEDPPGLLRDRAGRAEQGDPIELRVHAHETLRQNEDENAGSSCWRNAARRSPNCVWNWAADMWASFAG